MRIITQKYIAGSYDASEKSPIKVNGGDYILCNATEELLNHSLRLHKDTTKKTLR